MDDPLRYFFDGVDPSTLEDFNGLGDFGVPRKSPSSEIGGSNSSPRFVNRFPALSKDPDRER